MDTVIGNAMQDYLQATKPDQDVPKLQYAAPELVDPFAAQKGYNPTNFNPMDYAGNMGRAAGKETWGDALWKGLKGMGHTAWQAFSTGPESTLRTYGAIATLGAVDTDAMSDADKLMSYYEDEQFRNANTVFDPTKQMVAGFMQNLGFTAGTMGYMVAEFAATELLTGWFTGGASGAISIGKNLPLLGRAVSALGKVFEAGEAIKDVATVNRLAETARLSAQTSEALQANRMSTLARENVSKVFAPFNNAFKDPSRVESFWQKALAAGERYMPIGGDIIKTGRELQQASRLGASTGELVQIGFNGLRRGVTEFAAAANEASLETVQTYGDLYKQLTDEYRSKTGQEPDNEAMRSIMDTASKASSANYTTNMGILLLSNKIQFNNLFQKYLPANKFLTQALENGSEKAFGVMGKIGGEAATRVYKRGALGELSRFGAIRRDFGTGKALKQGAMSLLKGLGSIETVEGLQENLQETSQVAWKEYYHDRYDKIPTSLAETTLHGLKSQVSGQGLETFLTGALTGAVMRPFHWASNKAMEKVNDLHGKSSAEDRKKSEENLDGAINTLNQFFADPKLGLKESIRNYRNQYEASTRMAEAGQAADKYAFGNAQTDALYHAVRASRTAGTDKLLAQTIRDIGESFDNDAFKEAWGIDPKDTRYKDSKTFLNKVADDVTHYGEIIDNLRRKFSPVVDGSVFKNKDRQLAYNYLRKATDEAIDTIAYNRIKADDAAKRAHGISQAFVNHESLGRSSDYVFRALTSKENLAAEMSILHSELSGLRNSAHDKAAREEINRKEEELDMLGQWSQHFSAEGFSDAAGANQPFLDKTVTLFGKILDHKNKQAGLKIQLNHQELREGFQDVLDYMALNKDTKAYMDAYNTLSHPEYFAKLHMNIGDGLMKAQIIHHLDALHTRGVLGSIYSGKDAGEVDKHIQESDPWKKLMAIYHSPNSALQQSEYIKKLVDELGEVVKKAHGEPATETPEAEVPVPEAPAAPAPAPAATPEPQFAARPAESGPGHVVVDDRGKTVTDEPVSLPQAQQLAENLNKNTSLGSLIAGQLGVGVPASAQATLVGAMENELEEYNQTHDTNIPDVGTFVQTPDGKKALQEAQQEMQESGPPVDRSENTVVHETRTALKSEQVFETVTPAGSEGQIANQIIELHEEIVDFTYRGLQNTGKNDNFDLDGIVSDLQQILTCL